MIASSVANSVEFSFPLRERLESLAGFNIAFVTALLLVATVLLLWSNQLSPIARRVLMALTTLSIVATVYTVLDLVTLNVPTPTSSRSLGFTFTNPQPWALRVVQIFRSLSAAALAVPALWLLLTTRTSRAGTGDSEEQFGVAGEVEQ